MSLERTLSEEAEKTRSYAEVMSEQLKGLRIWDYLKYDEEGNLRINDWSVEQIAKASGTPIEIVDTTIIEKRAQEWNDLSQSVAERVGYKGGIEYYYAQKADPSSEVSAAAVRTGWNLETSSQLDLMNIERLIDAGVVGIDEVKVVCNGLKLHPLEYSLPDRNAELPPEIIFKGGLKRSIRTYESSYSEMISTLRGKGMDITPIIDSVDELNYFGQPNEIPNMDVGVRLKVYGPATNDEELNILVARHGMDWDTIQEAAERIDKIDHLKLTTFHAMVGAAETIPVDTLVGSLLFCADKYFQLRKDHPSLKYFNMGGGVPPLGFGYNHEEFIEKLFTGLKDKAQEYGQTEPVMVFEFGSYLAAEAGFHVMKVLKEKTNNVEVDGSEVPWLVVDLTLMRAIPDMLVIDRDDYVVLAVNNANAPVKEVRLGDLTCDSDGRWPTKQMEPKKLLVPDTDEPQYLILIATGAYGETLTGIGGVGHCGIMEPGEVIIENIGGQLHARTKPRQEVDQAGVLTGYGKRDLEYLKKVADARRATSGSEQ